MNIFHLSVLILFFSFPSFSQHKLSGTITDKETKEPLPGAYIYIHDLQKGTSTDAKGHYEIEDLPRGTFIVEVEFIGYSTQALKINTEKETLLNVELSVSVTEMAEVTVTGSSASIERAFNPVPVVVLDNLSNSQVITTNIIDAVANVPGISQVTTGNGIAKPIIRGLGFNRVVVLNNNIRQEGQQWGDEHGVEIDEFGVDKVEIIKGPGSLMYGSDALAGVIHFINSKPVDIGSIIGNFIGNYQTNGNLSGFSALNAGNINGINWQARISSKNAGNYSNHYDGKIYNSGFKELDFYGLVGINKRWGYSQIYLSSFNQSLGLIEGERDSIGRFTKPVIINNAIYPQSVSHSELNGHQLGIPKQNIEHIKIGISNKLFINRSSLSLNVAFQQNNRKEYSDPLNGHHAGLYFLLNTLNYDLKYLLPERRGWQPSIGFNGMYQRSENKGSEYLIPTYNLLDVGVFALTQKSFNRISVSGGFRYDIRDVHALPLSLNSLGQPVDRLDPLSTVKFIGFETLFSNYSASFGVSYKINEPWVIKVNASRGFRSPNLAELGSNGVHEGTFRYEIGNPRLKPETSIQTDIGILYNSDHISIECAAFNNSINKYIYLQKLENTFGGDSIVDPTDPMPTFQFTQGKAQLYGGELSMDIHPHPLDWLHIENSFSYVRGIQPHQPDSMKYLPFMPAPKWQSTIRANINKVGLYIKNFYIKIDAIYTMDQNHILKAYHTETTTPGYTLINTGIGGDLVNSKGNTVFTLSFSGNNLLDVAYQSHLSRLKYAPENPATGRIGIFNMGRNFSFRISIPLIFRKGK